MLTERQLPALERAKEEKIAYCEIEAKHVGYLGSQDTFYVGIINGFSPIVVRNIAVKLMNMIINYFLL